MKEFFKDIMNKEIEVIDLFFIIYVSVGIIYPILTIILVNILNIKQHLFLFLLTFLYIVVLFFLLAFKNKIFKNKSEEGI